MNTSPYPEDKASSLSREDLVEEYRRMGIKCQGLMKQVESGKQQIYELNRSLQSGVATQEYLSAELESLQSSRDAELSAVRQRNALEIEKLKSEIGNLQSERATLERLIEEAKGRLAEQEEDFRRRLAEKDAEKTLNVSHTESSFDSHTELVDKVNDLEEKVFLLTNTRQELMQEREELRERLEILQSRVERCQEELEEKNLWNEELQGKLFELNTEMAALRNDPTMKTKGNSLFSEVDDQRQKMKAILAAQLKKYNQMKTVYRESQSEIKRLKQENADIAEEFNYIRNMFINADLNYKKELMANMGDLRKENEALRDKVRWTEEKLYQTAKEQGVNWVQEMLKYSDNQVNRVEVNLKRVLREKIELDETHHKMQQDLAQWRYKSLKYKCALINRELLLEECGVAFQDIREIPLNPTVEVDIHDLNDTFERQVKMEIPDGMKKSPEIPIFEDTLEPETNKENSPRNKIHFRDLKMPLIPAKSPNQKTSVSPVDVYLDSNAGTSSRDNLPATVERHRDTQGTKTAFTIKKIVFRK